MMLGKPKKRINLYFHPFFKRKIHRKNSNDENSNTISNINRTAILPNIYQSSKPILNLSKQRISPIKDYTLSSIPTEPSLPFKANHLKKHRSHIQSSATTKIILPKVSIVKSMKSSTLLLSVIKNEVKVIGDTQQGKDEYGNLKLNQDSYLIMKNIFDNSSYDIIGIFDGHGVNGKNVSSKLLKETNDYFSNVNNFSNTSSYVIFHKLIRHECQFIKNFFDYLQDRLVFADFDIHFSGSTCIIIYIIAKHIVTANTGDSRGILVSRNPNSKSSTIVTQLSIDHKPTLSKERERIEKSNGIISKEDNGPYRVWQAGENFPGIAMSRSMGDLVAKQLGVIYQPEVTVREITSDDMYIVLASDGVWELVDNETVMEIVNEYYRRGDPKGATKALIEEATRRFDEINEARDDISVIVYFLNNQSM